MGMMMRSNATGDRDAVRSALEADGDDDNLSCLLG